MNKIITIVMTAIVGIILLGGLLMPIITEAAEDTYINDSGTTLDMVSESVSGSVDLTTDTPTITIDGKSITKYADGSRVTILETDMFRLGLSTESYQGAIDYWNGSAAYHLTDAFDSATFEVSGKTAIVTYIKDDTPTTITVPYSDWAFVISDDGYYADISAYWGNMIYYGDTSQVYSGYYTYTAGYWYSFHGTQAKVNGSDAMVTYASTPIEGTTGHTARIGYQESDIVVTFTTATRDATANVFNIIVPNKVIVTKENGLGLLYVVPILVIVAILMTAVRMAVSRSD